MKKFIVISILLGFGLMITLNSCKKKEEETTPATLTSTATIKGKVRAELDTDNTDLEAAPATIFVTLDSQDLVDNPQYDNKSLTYSGSVDANGDYSISIPAGSKPFSVTISGSDFVYMQNQPSPIEDIRTKYDITPRTSSDITSGKVIVEDFVYNDTPAVQ